MGVKVRIGSGADIVSRELDGANVLRSVKRYVRFMNHYSFISVDDETGHGLHQKRGILETLGTQKDPKYFQNSLFMTKSNSSVAKHIKLSSSMQSLGGSTFFCRQNQILIIRLSVDIYLP